MSFPMKALHKHRCLLLNRRKMMSAATTPSLTTRAAKKEGSIADIFTSLTGGEQAALPPRFADLKKMLWRDEMVDSWKDVLEKLPKAIEEIEAKGSEIVPRVQYEDLGSNYSRIIQEIKTRGAVIVQGGVPIQKALAWKQSILDYVALNKNRVKGFPQDNIQVFEIYNSKAQIEARTHPAIVNTQNFLLSKLWHASDPTSEINLSNPISYFDRLRIRQPGDAKFTLGPHVDCGSVERWEDPGFRQVVKKILEGGSNWREHDSFDASPWLLAKQDMYNKSNACSIFRPWQGWTSLSYCGPNQGTLRVLPILKLATAYMTLRPFFYVNPTNMNDWSVDLESSCFPGSGLGTTQELNEKTHPHLQLGRSMVSIPNVVPGDQVFVGHCDLVHAVEGQHRGKSDSSVFYIPAVPLTLGNASYLSHQKANFFKGLSPPDFPGGEGESQFVGRATVNETLSNEAKRILGLEALSAGV
ncbi:hypothetical protein CPB83DRAFT_94441 [Crepidotus variabilis]|uniref:DUF1479-domain-containing protein n=1 Tax=Crepidotus variabilis TaxID=179855 RepID=A0A9P6E4X6_9AGAR|nr:hypothetical protein CPB83DRAFT_94441 [Crepidotus variabilis]